jgi:hypothetical protein
MKKRSGRRRKSARKSGLTSPAAAARPTTKAKRSVVRTGDVVANAAILIASAVRSLVLGSIR